MKVEKMASLSRTAEDFLRDIERMEGEIAIHKVNIEKNVSEYIEVDRSVQEVKMLQDKARHVIKCNERKSQRYCDEMKEIEQCFTYCKNDEAVGHDSFTDLLAKIGEMKKTKIKLENDLDNQKKKFGQLETMWPEVPKKYEKIKEECDFSDIKSEI